VRAELRDRPHESMHRRIVDAVHDVEHEHVIALGTPFDHMLRLFFEKPEGDRSDRHAARRSDGQRQKAMAPLHAFFLRRITNRWSIRAPHPFS
jgi:hypothetical protein